MTSLISALYITFIRAAAEIHTCRKQTGRSDGPIASLTALPPGLALLYHHPPVLGQWRTAHLFDIIAAIRLPFLERLDVNTQGINPLARSTAVRIMITAGLRKKQNTCTHRRRKQPTRERTRMKKGSEEWVRERGADKGAGSWAAKAQHTQAKNVATPASTLYTAE